MDRARTIVIVGGGFAGVDCARLLERRLPAGWEVILFSRENHLVFTPLLADVVGASINPLHVVWPVRQMARRVLCRTATVTSIDLSRREVSYETAAGRAASEPYDHLILACGSVVHLDILPGMAAHGWPLKTVGDALALRNHLIGQLEQAEVETDPAVRKRLLSFVVVGGGFSGVEVAGEMWDLLTASCRFYRSLRPSDIHLTLLQARERLLPELPESLAQFAYRRMTARGIQVRLNSWAQAVTERGVVLDGNEEIEGGTVVCTIGTTVNPMIAALKLPLSKGRLPVEPDFRVQGQESLWALGDCAAVTNAYDQQLAPPTAQVAVQEARQLVGNLIRAIHGQPTRPFQYKMRGMFASIGHRNAVGQVYGLNFSGFFAWFLWRGIYLGKMPTLARKIQIAFDWFWELFFPRDIVQLTTAQTERLGRAHFEPGQFVFRKGDPATKFYVIERGAAGVYLDEAAEPVAILAPGDHFGEQAILQASRRTASVRALEPLDVITIGHSSFADLLRNLSVLRVEMQRSVQRIKASNAFMDAAKHHPRLNQMRARDVMIHPVQTLPCTLSFHQALARAQQEGKGAYPIVDEQGRMLGICSRTDFYRAMRELKPPDTPLVEIMSRPVITAKESDSLTSVVLTFLREPIKRIMVVRDDDESFPVGVLTPFDILPIISQDRAPALAAIPAGLAPTAV